MVDLLRMIEKQKEKKRKRKERERDQAPFSPSVASLCHPGITTTNLSYRFPIFETSATALCGTIGKGSNCFFLIFLLTVLR
jgi:hypothetical protein